jgi:hypothetical protein
MAFGSKKEITKPSFKERPRTKDLYKATMDSFAAMGDIEMSMVYTAYSKEVTY